MGELMFGSNEIIGQKYFKDAGEKLLITSVFATLQGEGPYSGQPAIFVRLAKCNLNCHFCDTYFDSGEWFTVPELIDKMITVANESGSILKSSEFGVVITGGEPLLQKNVVNFTSALGVYFSNFVQLESNGIVYQSFSNDVTLVISPKVNERTGQYYKPHKSNLEIAKCLKFVVESDGFYSDIPNWAKEWKKETGNEIFISPMNIYNKEPEQAKVQRATNKNTTIDERSETEETIDFWEPGLLDMEKNQKNHNYAAKFCIKHGLRLSLQQHLYCGVA
jgi:organic radical activating enzyme